MALRGAMTGLPMMVLLGLCGVCFGAVYKVGDSVGWTTLGNPDYVKWASGKKFHVGDSIVFEYHKQFHNVMQVPQPDFKSCNASSPILSYTSGHDSITLKKPGDYYFLCGIPGHCQSGQKVAIKVAGGSHGPAASPGSAPSVTTPSASPLGSPSMLTSPTPSQNGGSVSRSSINLLLALSCGVIYVANFVY